MMRGTRMEVMTQVVVGLSVRVTIGVLPQPKGRPLYHPFCPYQFCGVARQPGAIELRGRFCDTLALTQPHQPSGSAFASRTHYPVPLLSYDFILDSSLLHLPRFPGPLTHHKTSGPSQRDPLLSPPRPPPALGPESFATHQPFWWIC